MSELDARLIDALHADPPPARDVMFRVAVLVRLERAHFRRRMAAAVAGAAVVAALVAVMTPAIETWMVTDLRPSLVALAGAAGLFALSDAMIASGCSVRTVVSPLSRLQYPS
jgi:hypothetical protein